jgi:hypothetical protein
VFTEELKAKNTDVMTKSRIVASWLTTFKGYRIKRRGMEPRPGLFGRMTYSNTWHLEASRREPASR